MKLLSVIVPTYNMERLLKKCLDSLVIRNQDLFGKLEVLVVNDGSTDSSSVIGHSYEKRFPDVFKVIDKENGNYGSCINSGLAEAIGKYVKVLDADDYYDTEVLEELIMLMTSIDVDLFVTDVTVVDKEYKQTGYRSSTLPKLCEGRLEPFFTDFSLACLQMHSVAYRRSKLIDNNYRQTTGVSYTDQEWMAMPMTYMETFYYLPKPLYQYLLGREGQTLDMRVTVKQADVRYMLLQKRVEEYAKLKKGNAISDKRLVYLKNRILDGCSLMYMDSVVYERFDVTKTREFDSTLKQIDEELWYDVESSNHVRYHGIPYVAYWRKHQRLAFLPKTLKLAIQIIKRF